MKFILLTEEFAEKITGYVSPNKSFMIENIERTPDKKPVLSIDALYQFPELFKDEKVEIIELSDDDIKKWEVEIFVENEKKIASGILKRMDNN